MYRYYATDWVVRPVDKTQLAEVVHAAAKCGCLLFYKDSTRREDGMYIVPFVLRAPSYSAMQTFVQAAKTAMGLDDWREIHEDEFDGAPFIGSRIVGFDTVSAIYGRANERQLPATL